MASTIRRIFTGVNIIIVCVAASLSATAAHAQHPAHRDLGSDTAARVIDPAHPGHRQLTGILKKGKLTYPKDKDNWYPPKGSPRTVTYYYLHLSEPVDLLSDKWNDNVLHQYDVGLALDPSVRDLRKLIGHKVTVSGDFPRGPAAVSGVPIGLQMTAFSIRLAK
jgi:hypothetical protein